MPRPSARAGATSESGESRYDWQGREPSDQDVVGAMFGGGLLGGLLGLAVGEETEDERREREDTPEIHGRRQERERQLRHVVLREKLTEAVRSETASAQKPIQLTRDEIVEIRRQVDEEMPLELATPQYLELTDDAQITTSGEISDLAEAPPTTGSRHDAAAAPTSPTAPATTETPAPPAPQPGPESQALAESPQTETVAAPEAGEESSGAAGDRRPSLVQTGAAALAGGAIGARLADRDGDEREADYEDTYPQDEEAARRIFAAATDVDIDVLSRRLWSRISREMRSELLDRPRAGRDRSPTFADTEQGTKQKGTHVALAADTQLGVGMRFKVTIDDTKYDLGSWSKVERARRHVGHRRVPRRRRQERASWYFPGLTKYSTVKLERAVQAEGTKTVREWLDSNSFKMKVQSGKVALLDAKSEEVMFWTLRHVIPGKWSISPFDANASKVAIEALELVHMGFLENE